MQLEFRTEHGVITQYIGNNTVVDEDYVMATGRCIADGAYLWGFSSLLLLTFCCYTLLFAMTLIILQTDVYWNSWSDRKHQSYSIYTDVMYLAGELKSVLGSLSTDSPCSPREVDKEVTQRRPGIHLEVDGLPPPRCRDRPEGRRQKRMRRHKGRPVAEQRASIDRLRLIVKAQSSVIPSGPLEGAHTAPSTERVLPEQSYELYDLSLRAQSPCFSDTSNEHADITDSQMQYQTLATSDDDADDDAIDVVDGTSGLRVSGS